MTDLFAVGVNSPMVADTIELGISLLRGGNVEVQKVNGLPTHQIQDTVQDFSKGTAQCCPSS